MCSWCIVILDNNYLSLIFIVRLNVRLKFIVMTLLLWFVSNIFFKLLIITVSNYYSNIIQKYHTKILNRKLKRNLKYFTFLLIFHL